MNEEDALLAEIYANHDEDTPRLVYADWLDEHGQHERAELIRLSFEMARLEHYSWPWELLREHGAEIEAMCRDRWLPHLDAEGKKRVKLSFDRGFLETVQIERGIPEDFQKLRSLPGVRELWIKDSTLTEETLRDIATFEQLDELGIVRTPFQTEWLALLDCLPPWTAVQIPSTEAGFEQAWEAFLQRRVARVPLAPVERLRQMFRRRLGPQRMYREYLSPGPILRGTLRSSNEFDLAALARIPELEHLDLVGGRQSESGLLSLARLPNLRSVKFDRTEAKTIAPLTTCTQLEKLHVTTENGILPDAGIEGLERLTNLRDLLLNGGSGALRDGAFRRLAPLKQLRSLEIHFGELKEDSFSVLAQLSKLEILKLDGPTDDEDIRPLAALRNLTCLVLLESRVTDAALWHLSGLAKLRTLLVRGGQSQITETAGRQLAHQLPGVAILLEHGVVKTPQRDMVFQRRPVGDCASLLCPIAWAPPEYREDYDGVYLSEDGWDHIDSRLDERAAEIVCSALGFDSNKSAAEDLEEDAKADYRSNPQVLERSVVPLAGTNAASCVIREGERQSLLCKLNLPDNRVTFIGRVVPERFEECRSLFAFIARSLRLGADARVGIGEEITVPISQLEGDTPCNGSRASNRGSTRSTGGTNRS